MVYSNVIDYITSNLELIEGVWYSKAKSIKSYPEEGNELCAQIEDDSFWFRHRNNCITTAVKNFPPNGFILDVGGGNGFVSLGLQKQALFSILIEPGVSGALNAKKRGINNVICATLENTGFKNNTVPAVGLFDVLEHIENDKEFLGIIFDLLNESGHLYITVPAYNFLWSTEDDYAGHKRRYSLKTLKKVLRESGFKIKYTTYFFLFLPIPIFLFRSIPSLFLKGKKNNNNLKKDHQPNSHLVDMLINKMLKPEVRMINLKKKMIFGGSCLVVANK